MLYCLLTLGWFYALQIIISGYNLVPWKSPWKNKNRSQLGWYLDNFQIWVKREPDKHLHVESQISVLLGPWPAISMLLATVVWLSVSVFILQVEVATDYLGKKKDKFGNLKWGKGKRSALLVTLNGLSVYIYVHAYAMELEPERCKLSFLGLMFHIFACCDFSFFACVWEVHNTSWVRSLLSDVGYPPNPNWISTAALF